jgi:predicted dehydrogenase
MFKLFNKTLQMKNSVSLFSKARFSQKVAGMGFTGQAGNIHVANLKELGADLVAITREGRQFEGLENFPLEGNLKELVDRGFDRCVISTVESVSGDHCKRALDAGFKHILLEKPGAIEWTEL